MKDIIWFGNTIKYVRECSAEAKQQIGYNLERVQRGLEPVDWKPMSSVGTGVNEIRIHLENEYRVIYVAKFPEAIYVLHSFVKKTQQTSKIDLDLARTRYTQMLKLRKSL